MTLQHVNVKLLLQNPADARLEPLIPVFHSWIETPSGDELLIDVADYTHVPAGPGIVLIGHEGNYSVDNSGNRLGVRYNRKAAVDGGNRSPWRKPRAPHCPPAGVWKKNRVSMENSASMDRRSKSSSTIAWSRPITPQRERRSTRTCATLPETVPRKRVFYFLH